MEALNQYNNDPETDRSVFKELECADVYEHKQKLMSARGPCEHQVVRFWEPEEVDGKAQERNINSHIFQWEEAWGKKIEPEDVMILYADYCVKTPPEETVHEGYKFILHREDGAWKMAGFGY